MDQKKQIEELSDDIYNFGGLRYGDMCDGDCDKVAEKLYAAGWRKKEWISVERRLPEGPGIDHLAMTCLVAAKVGDEVVVDLAVRTACWQYPFHKAEFFWEIYHDWDEGQGCEITHWMPLPEPPRMR